MDPHRDQQISRQPPRGSRHPPSHHQHPPLHNNSSPGPNSKLSHTAASPTPARRHPAGGRSYTSQPGPPFGFGNAVSAPARRVAAASANSPPSPTSVSASTETTISSSTTSGHAKSSALLPSHRLLAQASRRNGVVATRTEHEPTPVPYRPSSPPASHGHIDALALRPRLFPAPNSNFGLQTHGTTSTSASALGTNPPVPPPSKRIVIPRPPLATPSPNLPNLLAIDALTPDLVAASREIDDHRTRPFSIAPPPYSDLDVPLPQPYNPAYPHPLTAYASPGVNSAAIRQVQWRQVLERMMATDPDTVKGSILAASDRDIHPPALVIPVFEGEGCGIPERLWSRFESGGGADALSMSLTSNCQPHQAQTQADHFSSDTRVPPRFAQAGIHVVATPGNRHVPSSSSVARDESFPFPAVRTNFSNILRRTSNDFDNSRPLAGRRGAQQSVPTPFHKTELCKTWEHEGTCKYGSNCQFAHGLLELRMPVTGMPTPPHQYEALAQPRIPTLETPKSITPPRMRPPTAAPYSGLGGHYGTQTHTQTRRQEDWVPPQNEPFAYYGSIEELTDSPLLLHRHLLTPPPTAIQPSLTPESESRSAAPLGLVGAIGAERAWRTAVVPRTPPSDNAQWRARTSLPVSVGPQTPSSSPEIGTESGYGYKFDSSPRASKTPAAVGSESISYISSKTSSSSLSASAASFHSTNSGADDSTATVCPFPSFTDGSFPPPPSTTSSAYILSPDVADFRPYVPVFTGGARANIRAGAEGEVKEWEIIKRSIDATVGAI